MTTPNGIRTESDRTPNASRAGALHSHIHSHIHMENPGRSPIHRYGLLARSARIAATCMRSLAATMDAAFGGDR